MTHANSISGQVHLVGSIGLDTVQEVYRTVGKMLGRRLRRVPDGEPGGRRLWIIWQYPLLRANPFLKVDVDAGRIDTIGAPRLCLADDVEPGEIRFGELGYAREARASYQDFRAARKRGELPANVRFQLCLPTPMAVTYAVCSAKDLPEIERAYEQAMIGEVQAMCRAVPHKDLCIQWDVCVEMIIWDGQKTERYSSEGYSSEGASNEAIMARMRRICAAVPKDVELGIHLCYGDFDARHSVQPIDAGKMVDLANALAKSIDRPIAYVHAPVPINRSDDAFFRPFSDLKLAPDTEFYLGVIHAADGVDGAKKRVAAARKYIGKFGIATECGMARAKKPDVVRALLEIHAKMAREPRARK